MRMLGPKRARAVSRYLLELTAPRPANDNAKPCECSACSIPHEAYMPPSELALCLKLGLVREVKPGVFVVTSDGKALARMT